MKILRTILSIIAHIIALPLYVLGGIFVGVAILVYWVFGVATPREILESGIISYICKYGHPIEDDVDEFENSQEMES